MAIDGVHTVAELKRLLDERGERYLRERMHNIGKVTAEEILEFLRFRTHNQNMTVAARAIADKKTLGHRS